MPNKLDKTPKVSVIIPTYNSAQYICETLDSVLAQTYKDYEIIVVDDGSTDNTREVLKPYMSKIKYIYKENGGPASARNVGIKNARGEYIAFLDSDDIWLPEKLEKQIEYLQSNPDIALVYSDCIRFNENGVCQRKSNVYHLREGYIFFKLLEGNFITTSTVIVRRECLDKVGYFDEELDDLKHSEDYDLWLRISRSFKIGYIREPLVKYRVRESGLNRSNIDRAYKALLKVFDKNTKDIQNLPDKYIRNCLFNIFLKWGISHFDRSNLYEARAPLAKAIRYKPASFRTIIYYLSTFLPLRFLNSLRKVKVNTLWFKG